MVGRAAVERLFIKVDGQKLNSARQPRPRIKPFSFQIGFYLKEGEGRRDLILAVYKHARHVRFVVGSELIKLCAVSFEIWPFFL